MKPETPLRLTAGITMLTFFENGIKVFAPFVLPQNNWSFDSGKTNGIMPAHVGCHALIRFESIAAGVSSVTNGVGQFELSEIKQPHGSERS